MLTALQEAEEALLAGRSDDALAAVQDALNRWNRPLSAARTPPSAAPRFPETFCSQCGNGFGPGDHGFSHCFNHKGRRVVS